MRAIQLLVVSFVALLAALGLLAMCGQQAPAIASPAAAPGVLTPTVTPTGDAWRVYTTADGLSSNNVTAVAVDPQGNVWVGMARDGWANTPGGVSRFDGQN